MLFGFGAASQSQGSLFGAPAQSQPSLFGAPSGAAQPAPSLFGAPAQSQPSLFGAPAQQSQPSLFGAPAQQSQPSLFGAPAQSQPSLFGAPAQSQPSLFGAPAQQSQPSLFGAPAQSQPSLFGAPAQSQQPSLFGAPAQSQPSLFGAPQSQPSLFGAPSQPQGSLFGAAAQPGGFGFAGQAPPQALPPQLPRALMELVERLNPMHPESRFHAALYNVVSSGDVSRYARPGDMDEKLWDEAVAKNPDPSRMVPVQANNFDDLLTRSDMQEGRLGEHAAFLGRLEAELASMEQHVDTEITTKLAAYRRRHRELARKLLRIASSVELAACRSDASGVLTQGEMERKRRLDTIARALAAPAEFKDKLSDLVELAESTVLDRRVQAAVEIRDPDAAAAIKDVLSDQLAGIQHLSKICERSERDIGIMTTALSER